MQSSAGAALADLVEQVQILEEVAELAEGNERSFGYVSWQKR